MKSNERVFVAIMFSLATGFMEGVNLSGDLANPGAFTTLSHPSNASIPF